MGDKTVPGFGESGTKIKETYEKNDIGYYVRRFVPVVLDKIRRIEGKWSHTTKSVVYRSGYQTVGGEEAEINIIKGT